MARPVCLTWITNLSSRTPVCFLSPQIIQPDFEPCLLWNKPHLIVSGKDRLHAPPTHFASQVARPPTTLTSLCFFAFSSPPTSNSCVNESPPSTCYLFIRQVKRFLSFRGLSRARSSAWTNYFRAKWKKVHGDDLSDSMVQGWPTLTSSGHKGTYTFKLIDPYTKIMAFMSTVWVFSHSYWFYLTWQERLNPLNVIL